MYLGSGCTAAISLTYSSLDDQSLAVAMRTTSYRLKQFAIRSRVYVEQMAPRTENVDVVHSITV